MSGRGGVTRWLFGVVVGVGVVTANVAPYELGMAL